MRAVYVPRARAGRRGNMNGRQERQVMPESGEKALPATVGSGMPRARGRALYNVRPSVRLFSASAPLWYAHTLPAHAR